MLKTHSSISPYVERKSRHVAIELCFLFLISTVDNPNY